MSNINFEEDQTKMLGKTENIQSLADQAERLNKFQIQMEDLEKTLKQTKKDFEHLSAEVIPTMMAEMGYPTSNLWMVLQ